MAILCKAQGVTRSTLSLYKILFYFEALSWESIILLLPLLTCKAYSIARPLRNLRPLTGLPFYAIHHTILVMALSCEGQIDAYWCRRARATARDVSEISAPVAVGLHRIFLLPILYGVWHDIVIANIVWCMAYNREVEGGSCIAHRSCNSIATVWAMQVGGRNASTIDSCANDLK